MTERYTEADFEEFRKLEHEKISDDCVVEWVFPRFGEPVLTFDRVTYYNAYRDRDLLTREQIRTLKREGALGCPPFEGGDSD